jgi:hypothetical protein
MKTDSPHSHFRRNIMRGQFIIASLAVGLVFGCGDANHSTPEKHESGSGSKVRVKAPGVDVEVEGKSRDSKGGKVKVEAPGVKVDVQKKRDKNDGKVDVDVLPRKD